MFNIPAAHYWFSGPAIFVPASLIIGLIVGFFGGKDRMSKKIAVIFWGGASLLALIGWWATSVQEKSTDESRQETHNLSVAVNRILENINGPALELPASSPSWIKVASKEIGQREIIGPEENIHIQEYFKSVDDKNHSDDIDDWASPFAEWSLQQVGKSGPKSMNPFDWLKWGKKTDTPEFGCIVVLSFGGLRHVGFYVGDQGDFIKVLGGNEDDTVRVSRYLKSAVVPGGYRLVP